MPAAVWNDVADEEEASAGEREPDPAEPGRPRDEDAPADPPPDVGERCCAGATAAASDFIGEADDLFPLMVLLGAGGAGSGRDWIPVASF